MSTRSIIARTVGDGFAGRYHHTDGYPTGVGEALFDLANGQFADDLHRMMKVLVDEHPAGWSSIFGQPFPKAADFSKVIGYAPYDKRTDGPACYCHGDRNEEEQLLTDLTDNTGTEWAYAIDADSAMMGIFRYTYVSKGWKLLDVVNLHGPVPDWGFIECGANFERCGCSARLHFQEAKGLRLNTQQWLGREPLTVEDCIAFTTPNGQRYEFNGSGSGVCPGLWRNFDGVPVYRRSRNGEMLPLPEYTYEYPRIPETAQ